MGKHNRPSVGFTVGRLKKNGQLDYNCPTLGQGRGYTRKLISWGTVNTTPQRGKNEVSSDAVGVSSMQGYSHKCLCHFLSKPIQIQSSEEGSNFFSTILTGKSEAKHQNYANQLAVGRGSSFSKTLHLSPDNLRGDRLWVIDCIQIWWRDGFCDSFHSK